MALLNSSNFLLYNGETPLGHSKNTTFNLSQDLLDTTNKDSDGWSEFIAGVRNGKLKSEGLTDYSDALNYEQLVDLLITRAPLTIYFKDFVNNKHIISGTGYIEAVSEKAETNNSVSFDLDIQLTSLIGVTNQRVWNTIFEYWNTISTAWNNL